MDKKVLIANDHGAIEIKQRILKHLESRGYAVNDLGVNSEESVDYPDYAEKAAKEFFMNPYEFGIVCCGTGIGISISANKLEGIRCALPQNSFAAHMAKAHNNANFLAFGGRIEYQEPVEEILDAFVDHTFEGGRHAKRVAKMMALEDIGSEE